MKKIIKDSVFAFLILITAFGINMFIKKIFGIDSLIPMIFVLGIFIISLKTDGYIT